MKNNRLAGKMKMDSLLKYSNAFKLMSLLTVATGSSYAAQVTGVTPGIYDNTIVAFDNSKKIVTGYFSESAANESSPSIQCEFYFAGVLSGSTAKLKIYQLALQAKPTFGTLKVGRTGEVSNINLQLEEEQPGCMNIYPKAELAKTKLAVVSPARWIEVRMAADKKVYFFKSMVPEMKTKAYITKGDVVGVLEYRGEWAKVVYNGEAKSTSGWIKVSQMFPSVIDETSQP
jgi:hypothetical protein